MFGKKKRNEKVYSFICSAIEEITNGASFRYAMGAIDGAFISGAITEEERQELRQEAQTALNYVKKANRTKRDIIAAKLWDKFENNN